MAKERMVNTKFWVDGFISNLDPIEKLLYLYLLTNPSTNIAGIYEIPIKNIAVDTGIDKEMVIKIFKRFEDEGKIKYKDGWLVIKNFIKHQKINPKITKGIEIIKETVPSWVIDYLESKEIKETLIKQEDLVENDRLSLVYDRLSHSNTNSNTNINTNTNSNNETSSPDVVLLIKAFENINPASKKFYSNTTQRKSCQSLLDDYGLERVLGVIENVLPKSNTMKFFPVITTPLQLVDKWATLESAIERYQSEQKNIKSKIAF